MTSKNLAYCKCGHMKLWHTANHHNRLTGKCNADPCPCQAFDRAITSARRLARAAASGAEPSNQEVMPGSRQTR